MASKMEDHRKPRYRYDTMSRQDILTSIPVYDPAVAELLIDECEIVATIHLHTIEFQSQFPNFDGAEQRAESILCHVRETLDLICFDGESELAGRFWRHIYTDVSGDVMQDRLDKFEKLIRSVQAAHHLLRRALERKILKSNWREDNSLSTLESEYIRDLAGVYWIALKRKPGRSKSTIGPFVRFAWAAMRPILDERMPTIDSLNDKWARLRIDITKSRIDQRSVRQFERYYFK
jgi:hypothetical protein